MLSANCGVLPLFENCTSLWLSIIIPGCELYDTGWVIEGSVVLTRAVQLSFPGKKQEEAGLACQCARGVVSVTCTSSQSVARSPRLLATRIHLLACPAAGFFHYD